MIYRSALLLALSFLGASPALAASLPKYTAVNLTLQQQLGDLTVSSADKASPVLGSKNYQVRQGVAYVTAGASQSDLNISVSPKFPLWLNLNISQGNAALHLARVPLRSLNITQKLGDLDLDVPAATLKINLNKSQGDTVINLPPNTGLQVTIQKFSQGTLTIQGKEVGSGLNVTGTFATSNYDSAAQKINLNVSSELGDLTIK